MIIRNNTGKFVISLDFEQYWGIRDIWTKEQYKENLYGVWDAVPEMLSLFKEYDIHVTWAIVGFLFGRNKEHLMNFLPQQLPTYHDQKFSPYDELMSLQINKSVEKVYFSFQLIEMIKSTANQEIATHTFCHYYCLEEGQTKENFTEDLKAALTIASEQGIAMEGIIFPRNQVNKEYLQVGKELGFKTYRGNEHSWIYKESKLGENTTFKRFLRLIDAYMNLTGYHTYRESELEKHPLINIPSSQFLRPYKKNLRLFEPLRLKRIKDKLTYAAKNNEVFHLWWHPHNFGKHVEENINFLKEVILHFKQLQQQYGMESVTMGELANKLINRKEKTMD
jgi:peptidoglycan/xylan/chitin deacetylase (PgdA/CDA1 family)